MQDSILTGIFHFTSNSLSENDVIENGLRARIIKNVGDEVGTPIEFILPLNEKIHLNENKNVTIKVASYLFVQQEITEKKPLIVGFSKTMLLGTFYPDPVQM